MIKLQVLDESLTHRDNGVTYVPNMTISPEQLPKSTRTYSKAPSLTHHGNVTGVTRKGKPAEGYTGRCWSTRQVTRGKKVKKRELGSLCARLNNEKPE